MKRGTIEHPKILMLEEEIDTIRAKHENEKERVIGSRAIAVGIIECLWHWTARYAIRGDIGKWPNSIICKGIGYEGDADELIAALIKCGWIDEHDEHRLVIHDIKDHADNCWRQCLEDADLTWYDGSNPRKYSINKKIPTNNIKSQANLQKISKKSPQPEPEPEPEPRKAMSGTSDKSSVPDVSPLINNEPKVKGNGAFREQAREVIAFLNGKTGRRYEPCEANVGMIVARMRGGATIKQLRQVVAKKVRDWTGDEKMEPYLRPATLFNRTKFAQYVGELGATGPPEMGGEDP